MKIRYNCPFTDKVVNVQPPFYTKEEAVACAQAEVEIAWEEFRQKFSCYIRPPTHLENELREQQKNIEKNIKVFTNYHLLWCCGTSQNDHFFGC